MATFELLLLRSDLSGPSLNLMKTAPSVIRLVTILMTEFGTAAGTVWRYQARWTGLDWTELNWTETGMDWTRLGLSPDGRRLVWNSIVMNSLAMKSLVTKRGER
jgi:hypothetical protein